MDKRYGDPLFRVPDRQPGEERLAASDCFLRNGLRLCCDVPVTALEDTGAPTPWKEFVGEWEEDYDEQHIDYLVCRGDDVVVSLQAMGKRERWLQEPKCVMGLPCIRVDAGQMAKGDVRELEERIRANLRRPSAHRWKCSLADIPAERFPDLTAARMLETRQSALRPGLAYTVPTPFGTDSGLVRVYASDTPEEAGFCRPAWSDRSADNAERILRSSVPHPAFRARVPLEERLKAQRSGLSANDAAWAGALAAMHAMSPGKGFAPYPEKLKILESFMAAEGTDFCFEDLALAIDAGLQDRARCREAAAALKALAELLAEHYERQKEATQR